MDMSATIAAPVATSRRGFLLRDRAMMVRLRSLMVPSTAASLRAYALDWAVVAAAAAVSWQAFRALGVGVPSLLIYLSAALAIASRQKGFDNLAHEASHYNLSRRRRVNDLMCYALGSMWLRPAMTLDGERRTHVIGHHGHFWDAVQDPKRAGHAALGLDQLPQPAPRAAWLVARAFLRAYRWHLLSIASGRFLRTIGAERALLLRGTIVAGVAGALVLAGLGLPLLLYWIVPALTVLPLVSFVAQLGEHTATPGASEFEKSRNCLGLVQCHLFHAHGDGYHIVHHLFPRMPHHHLAQAHRLLMQDAVYRSGNHVHGFGLLTRRRGLCTDLVAGQAGGQP